MQVGYCRVSTGDQSLALQTDALRAAGCERIFEDVGSGSTQDRAGLIGALKSLSRGDVLVIWRLDRLARSVQDLADMMAGMDRRGIGLRSLCEHIDTVSATGRLTLHLLGAFAEFERALIIERTRAGMEAARARGVKLGRPRKLEAAMLMEARFLIERGLSVEEAAAHLGIGRSTLYRGLSKCSCYVLDGKEAEVL